MRRILSRILRRTDESGAVLIMALVFLIVGSLVAVALTTESATSIKNTSNLQLLRTVNYAADGAMDGAIQQNRYHGSCESFPKSGSLQLTSGEYVYVSCVSTPIPVIAVLETSGSTTLSSPTSSFSSAYATSAQPVSTSSGTSVGTITAVATSGSTATMSVAATATGTVYVGEAGDRFDTFTACASSVSISSCAAKPEITANVLFGDICPGTPGCASETPEEGYTATVETWTVADANA